MLLLKNSISSCNKFPLGRLFFLLDWLFMRNGCVHDSSLSIRHSLKIISQHLCLQFIKLCQHFVMIKNLAKELLFPFSLGHQVLMVIVYFFKFLNRNLILKFFENLITGFHCFCHLNIDHGRFNIVHSLC